MFLIVPEINRARAEALAWVYYPWSRFSRCRPALVPMMQRVAAASSVLPASAAGIADARRWGLS